MHFVYLACGIALLLFGGTLLVRGASSLASKLGVSPLVVGLTIVAFGTSSPELVVNVVAALNNQPEIALGNVVGSNIANLGLVLGAVALFVPVLIQSRVLLREVPLMILATTALLVMTFDGVFRGEIAMLDRSDGILLLLLFFVFLYMIATDVMRQRADSLVVGAGQIKLPEGSSGKSWLFVGIGSALLLLGGEMTITNAVWMASVLGISEVVIGLAVVAVGTSLPELVTSLIAVHRNEPDLSVGSLIGSNLFNTLFVLPLGVLINPIPIPAGATLDVVASLLFAVALIPVFVIGKSYLGRYSGAMFLILYLAFLVYRSVGGFI